MKTLLLWIRLIVITGFINLFISAPSCLAQVTQTCSTVIANGQNLTSNSDFSKGNTGFTYSTGGTGYTYFTCGSAMPSSSCYSGPGNIWVGAHSDWFNQGFNQGSAGFGNTITDHSAGADNNFLMVDGTCTSGNDAWGQVIPVTVGQWYYFECWVNNLNVNPGANGNASLNLNINNQVKLTFNPPPGTQGTWVHYSYTWQADVATADIAIQNTTSTGCGTGVDFGLDDITFTPGCAYADVSTPQPSLGSDGTLCGKNGAGITLSNLNHTAGLTYQWVNSAGTTISSAGPSLTPNVTTPGTYAVCVKSSGGCLKSDVITISATYTLTSQSPTLCNPASSLLDPGFNGTNVTFQWLKSTNNGATYTPIVGAAGTGPTYLANDDGWYKVNVNDPTPGCGAKTSPVFKVASQQTATPNNVYFCPPGQPTFSVTGAPGSTYKWYTNAAGTTSVTPATTGTSYTPATAIGSSGDAPGTQYTFYAKDITTYREDNGGASTLPASGNSQTGLDQYYTAFTANQSFFIDSVTVYWWLNNSNNDPLTITFQLYNNLPGNGVAPSKNGAAGPTFTTTNNGAQTLKIISPPFHTPGQTIYAVRVPVKVNVPAAGNYALSVATSPSTTGNVQIQQSGTHYPYPDAAGVYSITGTAQGNNNVGTTYYGDLYDWSITYPLNCLPVPVIATKDCSQPQPVEFISFKANHQDNYIYLTWSTATEKNSSYFVIEKSQDGINFSSVGQIKAAGSSSNILNYSFTDHSSETGTIYYRVVEYDIDGSTTVSEIKSVNSKLLDFIKIVPNPNHGNFSVIMEGLDNIAFQLSLYNALGENVYHSNDRTNSDNHIKNIEIQTLPSGIYFLHIQSSGKRWVEKIVKQ
jgi:hypothetical protein